MRSALPADAFSGARAFGTEAAPEPESLLGMAAAFPDRRAGSSADLRLADLVAQVLPGPGRAGRTGQFQRPPHRHARRGRGTS